MRADDQPGADDRAVRQHGALARGLALPVALAVLPHGRVLVDGLARASRDRRCRRRRRRSGRGRGRGGARRARVIAGGVDRRVPGAAAQRRRRRRGRRATCSAVGPRPWRPARVDVSSWPRASASAATWRPRNTVPPRIRMRMTRNLAVALWQPVLQRALDGRVERVEPVQRQRLRRPEAPAGRGSGPWWVSTQCASASRRSSGSRSASRSRWPSTTWPSRRPSSVSPISAP